MTAQSTMLDVAAPAERTRAAKDGIIRRKDLSHSIIDCHKLEDAIWCGLRDQGCDEQSNALQIDQALDQLACPAWCEPAAWDRIAESFRTWSTIFGNLQLFWQLRRKRDD